MASKKGVTFYHCKLCNDDNSGGIFAVRKHAKSQKHLRAINSVQNIVQINKMVSTQGATNVEKLTKEAEIRLSMFITEHNISIRTSDHLVQLFKTICPESEAVKSMTCNRTKTTRIINNVVGEYYYTSLIKRMATNKFSLLIDESTDMGSIKHLAVVVRMTDSCTIKVKDEFVTLLPVADATSQNIFNILINFFNTSNILYKNNMIGFASDGANAMFGCKNSVKTLFESEINGVFVMKCLCHSLALCCSYACEKIPDEVENLIRGIYTYMKYSYKRQKNFVEFQNFIESKPHKLLQPSQTRWLSLLACVKRVTEQFPALKLYFQGEHLIDQKAKELYSMICNPFNKLYLYFLEYCLPIMNNLTLEFQSEKPKIHSIYIKMESTYKTILECYIQNDYLKSLDVSKIQYRNPNKFVKNNEVY